MDTPRTDEQEDRCNNCGIRFVDRDFARQLERELSAALAAKERLEEVVRDAIELHRHATFDNGVEDNAGHKEADYWAAQWDEQARAALALQRDLMFVRSARDQYMDRLNSTMDELAACRETFANSRRDHDL